MTRFERKLARHLRNLRLSAFDRQFVKSLKEEVVLSSERHLALCRCVVRYRRQLIDPSIPFFTTSQRCVLLAREELEHYSNGRGQFEEQLDANPADHGVRSTYAQRLAEGAYHELSWAQQWMCQTDNFPNLDADGMWFIRYMPKDYDRTRTDPFGGGTVGMTTQRDDTRAMLEALIARVLRSGMVKGWERQRRR